MAVTLLCLAHAGGSAAAFRTWPARLPGIEVRAVDLPGRASRLARPPFDRLEPLARWLAREELERLEGPVALFGHSMGALVAFALAGLLRDRARRPPVHLLVAGCPAPQLIRTRDPLHALPRAEFLERLRALDGTPSEVFGHAELLDLLLPAIRADLAVYETFTYRPATPLGCPVTAFGGLDDPDVSRADLEAWRVQTTGPFRLVLLPGGHFFLHDREAAMLSAVAQALR